MLVNKTLLNKMTKEELIDLILENQNKETTSREFVLYSYLTMRGEKVKKCSINLSLNGNILVVKHRYLTPTGYGDNGLGGIEEIVLNKTQLDFLKKNTFKDFMIKFFDYKEHLNNGLEAPYKSSLFDSLKRFQHLV